MSYHEWWAKHSLTHPWPPLPSGPSMDLWCEAAFEAGRKEGLREARRSLPDFHDTDRIDCVCGEAYSGLNLVHLAKQYGGCHWRYGSEWQQLAPYGGSPDDEA